MLELLSSQNDSLVFLSTLYNFVINSLALADHKIGQEKS